MIGIDVDPPLAGGVSSPVLQAMSIQRSTFMISSGQEVDKNE